MTKKDLESDLSIAQEAMDEVISSMFTKVLNVIDKEDKQGMAIVALLEEDSMHIHIIDAEEANKRIDEASSGLIL